MELEERIKLLSRLEIFLSRETSELEALKEQAFRINPWFIPEFTQKALESIRKEFLVADKLKKWTAAYGKDRFSSKKAKVGLILAGNIPLVGFHDFLCGFISGCELWIKTSEKDKTLIKYLVKKMEQWAGEQGATLRISFPERLKGCDAFIATGSANTSRYFTYYFSRYPHIIRSNRTSIAILDGSETQEELVSLGQDMMLYFGLGCRNITKIYVPQNYDFTPLLKSLEKYRYLLNYQKYKNNYDYNLAMHIMGNQKYMDNGCVLFSEQESFFAPVGQINYAYYDQREELSKKLTKSNEIQCIAGHGFLEFGQAQTPSLNDYADGIDTLEFLTGLS